MADVTCRRGPATAGLKTLTAYHILLLTLFCLYYTTKPIYVLPSGQPQPADGVAVLLFFAAVMSRPLIYRGHSGAIFSCATFVCYAIVVNLIWFIFTEDSLAGKTMLYLLFNLFVFYATVKTVIALPADVGARAIAYVAAITVVAYAVAAVVAPSAVVGTRETLFFNNPNQLGYWGLLTACIIVLVNEYHPLRRAIFILGVGGAFYLCLLSLSKAAIISFLFLLATTSSRNVFILGGVALLGISLVALDANLPLVDNAKSRLYTIGGQRDDSASGRGYSRIAEHPEHLVLGAGERSTEPELHSTLGTVLFSYGVIGLLLFCNFLYMSVKTDLLVKGLILAPPMLYGLTHQGLRFSILWVLLALLCSLERMTVTSSVVFRQKLDA